MECPKCKKFLKEQPVVKWKNNGGTKIIGKQKFCPNMNCHYEGPIVRCR